MTDLILTEDDFQEMVWVSDGKAITTSLKVAKYFGKSHDKVLRDIRKLGCTENFRLANFGESSYINEQGKIQPMFTMTKDGWMFLVMGFTGSKAGILKESFIAAFNWLIDQLANRQISFDQRRNEILLEYKQKKGMASMAGKLMRHWQLEKPIIEGEMFAIEQDGQGVLQLH